MSLQDLITNINKSIDVLNRELATLRVGRAHPSILDNVRVDYYGAKTPINQMANIACPEARMITVSPYDKSQLKPIQKAIQESNLDINPQIDGEFLRIAIPAPTEERRKEYARSAKQFGEKAKVAIRAIRHDALHAMTGSQDEQAKSKKAIEQAITDAGARIDGIVANKEKEILTV